MSKTRTPLDELAELLKNPTHNLSVDVYNEDKKIIKEPGVKRHKSKYTLNGLGSRMDRFETKLDKIADLVIEMSSNLKKVNTRLDRIEDRLDGVDARLDYNGLQIQQIEKRLDYNGLKKLPTSK